MSVNSSMTAIADKIRALLGISGKMGLDAMATNLGTEQINIANAFTAINDKGGTVPSSKVSGNLASAINSIPLGVTVQSVSGTFTTDKNGAATVNCGFKPDLVMLHNNGGWDGGYIFNAAAAFNEEQRDGTIDIVLWDGNTDEADVNAIHDICIDQSSTGFSVKVLTYTYDWEEIYGRLTLNYVAVKYT